VKGLRVAGVTTIEQANHYLQTEFVPWWNQTLAVAAANPDDAHRPLEKHPDLAAILSHVEARPVHNDYTIQFEAKVYQIARKDIGAGLRGALVRVEKRRDGSVAVRFHERYLAVSVCEPRPKLKPPKAAPTAPVRQTSQAQRVGPELRSEEGPPDLAGGTKFRRQTGGVSLMLLRNRLRKWREAKSRPIQGNPGCGSVPGSPNDRILHGPGCYRHNRVCVDFFPATPSPRLPRTPKILGMRLFRQTESIGPMGSPRPLKAGAGVPPPVVRPRGPAKGRDGRGAPCSSSATSSDRLFLDRVARQHCPSPLHRHAQTNMHPLPGL
jgi:hypothetical protein